MAVSPEWRYILANSSDLSHVGELKAASGKQLSLVFNRPGTVQLRFPSTEELAPLIWPITSAIKAYRRGSDDAWSLIWSGYVWTMEEDISGEHLTIQAQGWLQWLEKRVLRRAKDYRGPHPSRTGLATDDPARWWRDHEIIYDLLNDANTTPITWDLNYSIPTPYSVGPSGSPVARPTPVGPGVISPAASDPVWATHGRQYSVDKYASILGEIYKLTDLENGCDVWVDPATRLLHVYAKKMTVRTGALFAHGWGPENLASIGRSIDPSTVVNRLDASGTNATVQARYADTQDVSFTAPSQPMPKLGENSMTAYGLIEEAISLSDAKTTDILATYAAAEILLRSSPRLTYSLTPYPYTTTLGPGRIPEPFIDYDLGDKVYLTVHAPKRILVDKQGMRVFGLTVGPDDAGNEIVSQLQVTP